MNKDEKKLTEPIKKANASLIDLQGVKLLEKWWWYEEWQWYEELQRFERKGRWVIRCRITINSPNRELVPNETDWYIWLEATYPRGEVELIPAKHNGITKTFHHQYVRQ